MSINSGFNLIGRLTTDPRIVDNGSKAAYLTLAVDKGYNNNSNQWVEKTEFQEVVVFGDGFVNMIQRVYHKGELIAIKGELGSRKIKNETGREISIPALRVEEIKKLATVKKAQHGQDAQDQHFNDQDAYYQQNQGYHSQNNGYGSEIPPQH